MSICKECLHNEVCTYGENRSNGMYCTGDKCKQYKSTADVVEVRHGEWEIKARSYRMIDDFDEELYVECPYCKRTFYVPYEFDDEKTLAYARENYPYCHCGAKMDGERKEGNEG